MTSSEKFTGERFHKAITLATKAHSKHLRRGTDIPYITHPFEVAQILTGVGASQELVIAGLLHDAIDHKDITLSEINKTLGHEVAELVKSCKEVKRNRWRERKQQSIDFIQNEATYDEMLLCAADKVSTLRDILTGYHEIGDTVWGRFQHGKPEQSWYYSNLIDSMNYIDDNPVYWELSRLYNRIFVYYYLSHDGNRLAQMGSEQCYVMHKESRHWDLIKQSKLNLTEFSEIPYEDAIALETEWLGVSAKSEPKNITFQYPFPNRTVLKHPDNLDPQYDPCYTLGFTEGMFSDGRPYLAELWATSGVKLVTVFMSGLGFDVLNNKEGPVVANTTNIQQYLEDQGIVQIVDTSLTTLEVRAFWDDNKHLMLSCNIAISSEEETYCDVCLPFWETKTFEENCKNPSCNSKTAEKNYKKFSPNW